MWYSHGWALLCTDMVCRTVAENFPLFSCVFTCTFLLSPSDLTCVQRVGGMLGCPQSSCVNASSHGRYLGRWVWGRMRFGLALNYC